MTYTIGRDRENPTQNQARFIHSGFTMAHESTSLALSDYHSLIRGTNLVPFSLLQICGRKTELSPQLRTFPDRAENGVVATKHRGCASEIAALNSGANGCAAYDRSVHFHRWDSDDVEVMLATELAQKREIASPIFSERPFVADTNFAQRLGALGQLRNEIFRLGLSEILVERNY